MMQQNQRAPKLQMSFIVKKHIGCGLPQMALVSPYIIVETMVLPAVLSAKWSEVSRNW